MGNKNNFLKNERGQSAVEYILLMGAVLSITLGVMRSAYFKRFFGNQSQVFDNYRLRMEHGYRHGFPGALATPIKKDERNSATHESYFSNGNTHFFFTREYGN